MTEKKVLPFKRPPQASVSDSSRHLHVGDDPLTDTETFDYDAYFERASERELSEAEGNEFTMRVLELFCRDFFKSGGDASKIPQWVMSYVANKMSMVLEGERWENAFPLPWALPDPNGNFTRVGRLAFDVYASVSNTLRDNPDAKVSHLLQDEADRRSISFQSARSYYYDIKSGIDNKIGIPDKYLKPLSDV